MNAEPRLKQTLIISLVSKMELSVSLESIILHTKNMAMVRQPNAKTHLVETGLTSFTKSGCQFPKSSMITNLLDAFRTRLRELFQLSMEK
jgi:hypothetical protein